MVRAAGDEPAALDWRRDAGPVCFSAMSDPILERLRVALAESYAIERELGRGGMATVYLARDIKHDRPVAVKVLEPALAASLGAERFLREIRITAKLSHPHILPLYDSGEAAGLLYYVMPYVVGESLADLLAREKQLAIRDAVQIIREAASALGHAHGQGLVHRDIKPQNIMMSGGHAIVADFGIARAVSEAGGNKLTQTGMSIGTPAYMSPEQIAGDESVDSRSDIYSLGCVLYELLVGQVPFTGPTAMAVMARHTMDIVPPMSIMRPSVPEELEDIVLRAMAKVPADRFRTALEFAEALETVDTTTAVHRRPSTAQRAGVRLRSRRRLALAAGGGVLAVAALLAVWWIAGRQKTGRADATGGLDPRRIAVLYFDDQTPGGVQQYIADGLTEGLIDELARVPALSVVSRNGVAGYRGSELGRDSIARALGAGTLITGSVEPERGDRLRVTVRLVEGISGADFQRASFVLPAANLLGLRDSLVREIAPILRERLGEEVRLREERAGTGNVAAWGLHQRGERARKEAEGLLQENDATGAFARFAASDSLFAESERADPRWAAPVIGRGRLAYRRARLAQEPREMLAAITTGLAHAERAVALAPQDAEALELRGTIRYFHWIQHLTPDPAAATRLLGAAKTDLEEAVRIQPTLASAHSTLSHLYYQTDDIPSALLAAQRAYEVDAYLAAANDILWRLFLGSYDLAQFTQAERWCAEGGRRFPQYYRFAECRLWLMTTPAVEANPAQAWGLLARLDSLTPGPIRSRTHHRALMVVGGVLARTGLADSARHVLVSARGGYAEDPGQELLFTEAFMRTLLGEQDEAINLLKRFVAANDPFQVGGDLHWWWRSLQSHPRFREVQARR